MMNTKVTGSCLCGAITFEYIGEIADAAYCHCTDCRKTTGSAFNISIGLPSEHFKIHSGTPKGFTKTADSGQQLTRHFCQDCGSPLFTTYPAKPEIVYVKAGVLNDPTVVRPAYQSWITSSVTWAHIPEKLKAFDKGR